MCQGCSGIARDKCAAALSLTIPLNAESALGVAKSFLRASGVQVFLLQAVRRDQRSGQWRIVIRIGRCSIFGTQMNPFIRGI